MPIAVHDYPPAATAVATHWNHGTHLTLLSATQTILLPSDLSALVIPHSLSPAESLSVPFDRETLFGQPDSAPVVSNY